MAVKVIRGDSSEEFDEGRLKQAIKRTAMSNRAPIGQAEDFASRAVGKIVSWLADKTEITGRELRSQTATALANYDPETAYLYENEKNLF